MIAIIITAISALTGGFDHTKRMNVTIRAYQERVMKDE